MNLTSGRGPKQNPVMCKAVSRNLDDHDEDFVTPHPSRTHDDPFLEKRSASTKFIGYHELSYRSVNESESKVIPMSNRWLLHLPPRFHDACTRPWKLSNCSDSYVLTVRGLSAPHGEALTRTHTGV